MRQLALMQQAALKIELPTEGDVGIWVLVFPAECVK